MELKAEVFPGMKNTNKRYVGSWYLRLVSDNGETVFTSEAYASRWNAERPAKALGLPYEVVERDA